MFFQTFTGKTEKKENTSALEKLNHCLLTKSLLYIGNIIIISSILLHTTEQTHIILSELHLKKKKKISKYCSCTHSYDFNIMIFIFCLKDVLLVMPQKTKMIQNLFSVKFGFLESCLLQQSWFIRETI